MPNPYGMAEFSVPQLLGLDMQMKNNRLQQMYLARQEQRQERQDERQMKIDARADQAYERGEKAREAIARGAKPQEVIGIDPATGLDYAKHSAAMDKEARAAAAERADAVGSAAVMVSRLPASQQPAAWDQAIDGLVARGYSDLAPYKGKYNPNALAGIIAESEKAIGHYLNSQNQDRTFGETVRHNKATEANAAGNLGLARQRENRIEKWGPQPLIGVMPQGDGSDLDAKYGGR